MSEYEQESISAVMDGEATELELRRLLKTMDTDPESAQRWQRYHLAQSVLHDQGVPVSESLAATVASRIEQEPVLASPNLQGWQQHLVRVAVAACVAVVAVIALQPRDTAPEMPAMAQQTSTEQVQPLVESPALVADSPTVEVDPVASQRLRDYIEGMRFDPEEPVRIEHLQDSPLYRLVNEYQAKP